MFVEEERVCWNPTIQSIVAESIQAARSRVCKTKAGSAVTPAPAQLDSKIWIKSDKSFQDRKNSMLTSHASCPHWQSSPSRPAHSPSQAQSQSRGQLWWRSKARLHHFLQAGNIFCIGKWSNMMDEDTKFVSISSHLKLMRQKGQSLCWGLQWSNVAGYLVPL